MEPLHNTTAKIPRQFSGLNSSRDWGDLINFEERTINRSKYPTEALGDNIENAVLRSSEICQAPVVLCANSFLAATNFVVQGFADLFIAGRRQPISDYFISISESGNRKSAADDAALHQMKDYEERKIRQYQKDKEVYKQSGDEGAPPVKQDLFVSNISIEGLQKLLVEGQPSIGLFTDEGAKFVSGYSMKDEQKLATGAFMNSMWDRGQYDRFRQGDMLGKVFGKRFSCHVMLQPELGKKLLQCPDLNDLGLMARFLVTDAEYEKKVFMPVNLRNDPLIKAFADNTNYLIRVKLPLQSGTKNELQPLPLIFDDDALVVYGDFHDEIQEEVMDGGKYREVRPLAAKIHDHAARIAATLFLFEQPIDKACPALPDAFPRLTPDYIRRGITIARFYLNEALRLRIDGSIPKDERLAKDLAEWCVNHAKAKGRNVLHLPEIYQGFGSEQVRNKPKVARRLMADLHERNYVRFAGRQEIESHFKNECFELHPYLLG